MHSLRSLAGTDRPMNPSRAAIATSDSAELGALREIVQLAAGASTWDELMQLIVDRSTRAMSAEVCSLYLLDRDGAGLTLAATNGVDREHIGGARLEHGEGGRENRPPRSWPACCDPR